jgi:hypothetical protein
MGKNVARMERSGIYIYIYILVRLPEGKRPLGKPRRRWIDRVKVFLIERVGWYGLD